MKKQKVSLKVEVDVSGQIGDTKDTVFALSNGENYSIVITGKVKRKCLIDYREKLESAKDFTLHFYLAGLSILFKSFDKNISVICLDREIIGHEYKIISYLKNRFCFDKNISSAIIRVTEIGKTSPAHFKAHDVFTKKQKADKKVKSEELIVEIEKALK